MSQTMPLPQGNSILECPDKKRNDVYGVESAESQKKDSVRYYMISSWADERLQEGCDLYGPWNWARL